MYLLKGNPAPGPEFGYKRAWFDRLIGHTQSLISARLPLLSPAMSSPTSAEIHPARSMDDIALLSPGSATPTLV
ncbi:hypothetical protein [Brevundimonas sp. NIBR10]|uniref:hypothetical protein n=1 Tax=Brevundimonas sp. NIBR10 TaxID=3015997 RepID=UPI0022F16925|nr:hypothetical protein [Brevundimonas sp. NIBR10]